MAKSSDEEHDYYQVLRVMIVSSMKGAAPGVAVEFGRRAIPSRLRPNFQDSENYIKGKSEAKAEGAPQTSEQPVAAT